MTDERRMDKRTRALQDAYKELEQKIKSLEKRALTDPLTNLPNRRAMDRLAERELRHRDSFPGPLAILLIDVDHFKSINERYLLVGGDKVLTDLAHRLGSAIGTIDVLGRIGGEEFMVIAPHADTDEAETLAERIRLAVEQTHFTYKDEVIHVRVSVGVAVLETEQQADCEALVHWASAALAEAKRSGRNRCVFYPLSGPEGDAGAPAGRPDVPWKSPPNNAARRRDDA